MQKVHKNEEDRGSHRITALRDQIVEKQKNIFSKR